MEPSSSSSLIRSWRSTFLTLRDEVVTSPPTTAALIILLNRLIFSQSNSLVASAPSLPSFEVTADIMFLLELARAVSESPLHDDDNDSVINSLSKLSYLFQDFSNRVSLELTSSSWALLLSTFRRMGEIFLGTAGTIRSSGNFEVIEATKQCLGTVRCLFSLYQRKNLLIESMHLLHFLLGILSSSQAAITSLCYPPENWRIAEDSVEMVLGYSSLWEVQTTTLTMISEVLLGVGNLITVEHWRSTIEVFRKIMDVLASKGLLVGYAVVDRFYTSLLQCLHVVLTNAKGSISDHVAGFVAALRMFLNYAVTSKSHKQLSMGCSKNGPSIANFDSNSVEPIKGPYRPPPLRKRNQMNLEPTHFRSLRILDHESTLSDHMSSDSDLSDSDGSAIDSCNFCGSRARVSAIICIQDLCRADPKSFLSQWTMLLPSGDVLHLRRQEASLMTCLLYDPSMKVRTASACALATMLEGPASIILQVAEYKVSTKCGSFMAFSSSIGQILMQLHLGILYLIKHEDHCRLLTSVFKVLTLLVSSTPYSRMPDELLPTVILDLRARIESGFPLRSDQTGLLAVALNCLASALSASPPSPKVKDMLVEELSAGLDEEKGKSGVLSTLFRCSQQVAKPTVSIEALQALKAVAHSYPGIMVSCFKQVSAIISGFVKPLPLDSSTRPFRKIGCHPIGITEEKSITSAVKLLDECLRAISGFKGTEDLSDDNSLGSPFISNYGKIKTISSAPLFGPEKVELTIHRCTMNTSATEQWFEATEKLIPSTLFHSSAMVRAASVTCFAGITSAVFFSLPEDKQDLIITYTLNAALDDEVPSVRSAACRAIGVIACFPNVFKSAEILGRFIHAAEVNSRHPLLLVRITASWTIANICDSIRHCINGSKYGKGSIDLRDGSQFISMLINCSLRLTKDGDKIKANAVRALGNLSRFVQCSSQLVIKDKQAEGGRLDKEAGSGERFFAGHSSVDSYGEHQKSNSRWMEEMVQAFIFCVSSGNVKVRWNVCHALSNLFLNETLKLQEVDWAASVFSVLLLLLRDSSNFKIRIQAAAALAVPSTIFDYGSSYFDVVQGLENTLENLSSDQILAPSSFKYRVALENQLTSTMLHLLSLASTTDHQPVQDFLVEKAPFLGEWLGLLCASIEDRSDQLEAELMSNRNLKKDVMLTALESLVDVYKCRNHHGIASKFDKLASKIS